MAETLAPAARRSWMACRYCWPITLTSASGLGPSTGSGRDAQGPRALGAEHFTCLVVGSIFLHFHFHLSLLGGDGWGKFDSRGWGQLECHWQVRAHSVLSRSSPQARPAARTPLDRPRAASQAQRSPERPATNIDCQQARCQCLQPPLPPRDRAATARLGARWSEERTCGGRRIA